MLIFALVAAVVACLLAIVIAEIIVRGRQAVDPAVGFPAMFALLFVGISHKACRAWRAAPSKTPRTCQPHPIRGQKPRQRPSRRAVKRFEVMLLRDAMDARP
jgi:hypothetical protein